MPLIGDAKREYQRKWREDRRNKAIILLGAKCSLCDNTEDLEFDHVYPSTKDPLLIKNGSGTIWSWSWKRILVELEKCWLLCKECHRIKTRDDRPDVLHGTVTRYNKYACRCTECVFAVRSYEKAWSNKN
jgi:5-methylcytosine-specific restriction endonuclease McrA